MSGVKTPPEFWSLFAGIEGFGAALEEAGMKCTLQVERDKDCNKVLERHFRDTPRVDDVNRLRAMLEPRNAKRVSRKFVRPFAICGGFPCQDLSVAGKRAGLAGSRSGLWFTFRRIIALVKPQFVLIENVPGLLSSNGGGDFGTVLGALGKCGYGYACRILDAQHFGVPQRRRRVFIVGCLGDWRVAARILFESDCLPWDNPQSQEAGTRIAPCVRGGTDSGSNEHGNKVVSRPLKAGGNLRHDESHDTMVISNCIQERYGKGVDSDCTQSLVVTHALTGEGHDASEDGTGRGTPLAVVSFGWNKSPSQTMQVSSDLFDPLKASRCSEPAICFDTTQITSPGNYSQLQPGDPCHPLAAGMHAPAIAFQLENDSPFESDEIASPTITAYQCHGSNVGPMGVLRKGNGHESGGVPFIVTGEQNESERGNLGSDRVCDLSASGMDSGNVDSASDSMTFAIQERASSQSETSGPGGKGYQENVAFTMESRHHTQSVASRMGVRRLTPRECERLQGFPDDWTRFDANGKEIADSPRYRMLGNAVNLAVGKWLARRIMGELSQLLPESST